MVVEKGTRRIVCVFVANGKRRDFWVFKDSKTRVNPEVTVETDSGYIGMGALHNKTVMPVKRKGLKKVKKRK
ncbi:hypothetical protein FACS18945_1620 [Bacteroidia bacterium]|nr:hypothetical protein FACS18945_1620 [Bacteroidia bacterium]